MKSILETTRGSARADVSRLLEGQHGKRGRLVCIFGAMEDEKIAVRYIVDVPGSVYRVLEDSIARKGTIQSLTPLSPAAAWYERELHDQYGLEIAGHPDPRPLLPHENWPVGCHPMAEMQPPVPWAEGGYPFLKVEGEGISEVAVGPVHAGVIEPGHFRFSVVGDNVLFLELRHFYTHKGTEKLFAGVPVGNGQMIAESVSGDNCFAHAVAYCQAVEKAHDVEAPLRAQWIRLIGMELERMMAHIADVGALSGDVAFLLPSAYCSRIKEDLLQAGTRAIGSRFWRGIAVPGGLGYDLSEAGVRALQAAVKQAAGDFAAMANIILDRPSVQSRFETAGILNRKVAEDLGVVGIVARASGIDMDVRRDHPYGAYKDLNVKVPAFHYGDVLARARMRIEEVAVSAELVVEALKELPCGPTRAELPQKLTFEGFSAVESPRGELLYWVKGTNGVLSRCSIKSPSFQNWPALPHAVAGNVIADFPLINKSFNLSYSGSDR